MTVFLCDASDEEKIAYVSKTYMYRVKRLRFQKAFVFNNPDQDWRSDTPSTPFEKSTFGFLLETGNPERDLLNELYTTALRSGLSPYSTRWKMVSFVIPHMQGSQTLHP